MLTAEVRQALDRIVEVATRSGERADASARATDDDALRSILTDFAALDARLVATLRAQLDSEPVPAPVGLEVDEEAFGRLFERLRGLLVRDETRVLLEARLRDTEELCAAFAAARELDLPELTRVLLIATGRNLHACREALIELARVHGAGAS